MTGRGMPTPTERERERIEVAARRATMFGENAAVAADKQQCRDRAVRVTGLAVLLLSAIVLFGVYVKLIAWAAERFPA